jgi:hypothetical protein
MAGFELVKAWHGLGTLGDALTIMVLYLPEERSEDLSVGLGPALLNEPFPQEVVGVHELLPGELFVTEGRWDWGDWTWQCGARVGCHCCKSSSRGSVHALQRPSTSTIFNVIL